MLAGGHGFSRAEKLRKCRGFNPCGRQARASSCRGRALARFLWSAAEFAGPVRAVQTIRKRGKRCAVTLTPLFLSSAAPS